ncbi:uncharacterized protein [Gossypium hirsutum]|uniref:Tf2-1-like SH3-like domain-containing protein n=1 Tax=Gossypium hirsutum TaxID=3635 RepID=A0ABM2ZNM7_GOSHI|nr:uncharacterized protein LOC107941953 [Gossypium hirsutum]
MGEGVDPTCWTELGERRVLGPELVADTEDKVKLIWDHLKEASDRKKSYVDLKRREIEYAMGDSVFLEVSLWKKVLRFGRKGKLSLRFIGPYRIAMRIGPVAYQLELPPELGQIHDVFHVSMLRRYRLDPSHFVVIEEIEVKPDLTFEEEPIQIIGRNVKVLRRKSVPLVKVLWCNHKVEEATWEPEEAVQRQHPQLFESDEKEDGPTNVDRQLVKRLTPLGSIELPKGPMTRARTKQLQDAISAFVMRIWEDNQLYNIGGAKNNSLKTPCTILQSDLSSSSAPPCAIEFPSAHLSSF